MKGEMCFKTDEDRPQRAPHWRKIPRRITACYIFPIHDILLESSLTLMVVPPKMCKINEEKEAHFVRLIGPDSGRLDWGSQTFAGTTVKGMLYLVFHRGQPNIKCNWRGSLLYILRHDNP